MDDEDDVSSATQCIYHATWKKYLVLSHHVTSLSTKDKRVVHSLLKRDDAKDTMFLPQYGITAGMFCTWQILRSTRRRSKKERAALLAPTQRHRPARGGHDGEGEEQMGEGEEEDEEEEQEEEEVAGGIKEGLPPPCAASPPRAASGERGQAKDVGNCDWRADRVWKEGSKCETRGGEEAPDAPPEVVVARRQSTRRGRR